MNPAAVAEGDIAPDLWSSVVVDFRKVRPAQKGEINGTGGVGHLRETLGNADVGLTSSGSTREPSCLPSSSHQFDAATDLGYSAVHVAMEVARAPFFFFEETSPPGTRQVL